MERIETVRRYVVDTSIVVKWFSEHGEDDLEASLSLRYQVLERKCSMVVPDLFFYEIANALRYNPNFTESDIKKALNSLFEMDFEIKFIEPELMTLTIEIAMRNNVTIYDACFLALSDMEKLPFITADYKFVKNINGIDNIIELSTLNS